MKLSVDELRVVAMTSPREAYEYENGKRTDQRVKNSSGKSVSRLRGVGAVVGDELIEVTLEVPEKLADEVQAGDVVVATGEAMTVELRGGDFGAVTGAVRDVETVASAGKLTAILGQLV